MKIITKIRSTVKGYKTLMVNGALLALSVTSYLADAKTLITSAIGNEKHAAIVIIGITVVNIVLRFCTSTPWGKNDSDH